MYVEVSYIIQELFLCLEIAFDTVLMIFYFFMSYNFSIDFNSWCIGFDPDISFNSGLLALILHYLWLNSWHALPLILAMQPLILLSTLQYFTKWLKQIPHQVVQSTKVSQVSPLLWMKPAVKWNQFHIHTNSSTVQMVSRILPKYDVHDSKAVPKKAEKPDKSKPPMANQGVKLLNCTGHFNAMALGLQRFL